MLSKGHVPGKGHDGAMVANFVGPWDPALSVHQRFPGLEGQSLLQRIYGTYLKTKSGHVHFFSKDASDSCGLRKLLFRHALNRDRDQQDTRHKYKGIIQKTGILTGCRSALICTQAPCTTTVFRVLVFDVFCCCC